ADYVKTVFNTIQQLIKDGQIVAGHDVASGGLITTLLEMCFADNNLGADIDLTNINEKDSYKILFGENAGIVFQSQNDAIEATLSKANIQFFNIGKVTSDDVLGIINRNEVFTMTIPRLRDMWFKTSFLVHQKQTANGLAKDRFDNYKTQPLNYNCPPHVTRLRDSARSDIKRPKAAIIREKGSNSERE